MARHLDTQQGGGPEAEETESTARLDAGDSERPIADDAAAEQGSGSKVFEAIRDADCDVGSDHHGFGETAVAVPTREQRPLAEVLATAPTEPARPIGPEEPVGAGPIADRPAANPIAEGGHASDRLVARHYRQATRRQVALGQLQIRPAHCASRHSEQQLAPTGNRFGQLDQPEGAISDGRWPLEPECAHAPSVPRPGGSVCQDRALEREQAPLHGQGGLAIGMTGAPVAAQSAVGADDPVAWDQDRERVSAHRSADRLRRARPADSPGQLAVTGRLAELEPGRARQDEAVPVANAQVDRDAEAPALAGEELGDLPRGLGQGRAPLNRDLAVFRGNHKAAEPPGQTVDEVWRLGAEVRCHDAH